MGFREYVRYIQSLKLRDWLIVSNLLGVVFLYWVVFGPIGAFKLATALVALAGVSMAFYGYQQVGVNIEAEGWSREEHDNWAKGLIAFGIVVSIIALAILFWLAPLYLFFFD